MIKKVFNVGDLVEFSFNQKHIGIVVFSIDPGCDVIKYDASHSATIGGSNTRKNDENYIIFSNDGWVRIAHRYVSMSKLNLIVSCF